MYVCLRVVVAVKTSLSLSVRIHQVGHSHLLCPSPRSNKECEVTQWHQDLRAGTRFRLSFHCLSSSPQSLAAFAGLGT